MYRSHQATHLTAVSWWIAQVSYEECDGMTIQQEVYSSCDSLRHMGYVWLIFGSLSLLLGVVGTVLLLCSAMCGGSMSKKIGSWALFIAGVFAIITSCSLAIGGENNFCFVHGRISSSPIMVIIAAATFQLAGILVGCYKPKT